MDLSWGAIAALAAAAFAGALVQAATGFGFAILAAPVFLAVIASKSAVPILVALHVVQSAMLVPKVWSLVPRRELLHLGLGAVAGCPTGLLLLHLLDLRQLKLATGVVILLATGFLALRSLRPSLLALPLRSGGPPGGPTAVTGAISGALTALLVMPGPPLMVLLARHPLAAEAARALALTFFAACYAAVLAMAVAGGTIGASDWRLVASLALPVVAGTLAGATVARRGGLRHFQVALMTLLVLAGLGAVLSAL